MNLVKKVYLIGHINPAHPETYLWRSEIMREFQDIPEISFINPCDSSFDSKLLDSQKEDPGRLAAYRKKGARIFVPKSRQSVDESTIAIANLDTYGSDAPMIGTMMELAWYIYY